jgi:hypothetical protein
MLYANAATLSELRISNPLHNPDDHTPLAFLERLLAAAPRLTRCEADVRCTFEEAPRLLRNEPPFGALRVRRLSLRYLEVEGDEAGLPPSLCAALGAHASLKSLQFCEAYLGAPATLDALVDAALVSLHTLDLVGCDLCPASAPALARLLRGGTLCALHIVGGDVALLDEPAAALLADALRANSTLTELSLVHARLWHDAAAAAALLGALTAHPSLRTLSCINNHVAGDATVCGAALGALIAANAPALTELDISRCNLGDAGMAPLVNALAANTHLHALNCDGSGMSEAFARDALLPAVRANTGLRSLVISWNDVMAMREAAALIAARARAAGEAQ